MRYIRSQLRGSRNLERLPAVVRVMDAYFWRTNENIVHHMRGESVADVRERIAATHGETIARRAVITSLHSPRADKSRLAESKSAAA